MGWRIDHNYHVARERDYRAFIASLTWAEWAMLHLRHKGPFFAGAASAALVAWLILY